MVELCASLTALYFDGRIFIIEESMNREILFSFYFLRSLNLSRNRNTRNYYSKSQFIYRFTIIVCILCTNKALMHVFYINTCINVYMNIYMCVYVCMYCIYTLYEFMYFT